MEGTLRVFMTIFGWESVLHFTNSVTVLFCVPKLVWDFPRL